LKACLSANGFDLLERMLCLNPDKRISAGIKYLLCSKRKKHYHAFKLTMQPCTIGEALKHEYFQERPAPKDMSLMPTYPEDET
jgi:hypothetical protein